MTLTGWEWCGRTETPLKYIKKWLPYTKYCFLHSSTGMSMACQKENKKMLNQWLQYARLLLVMLSIVLCFPWHLLCESLCDSISVGDLYMFTINSYVAVPLSGPP